MQNYEEEPTRDRFRGCLLGLAVGDALGAPFESLPRGSFGPVKALGEEGARDLPPGAWTDDTSMALCLAMSLLEKGFFDPKDQMERYRRWLDEGYLSSTGYAFGIGGTTARSIALYKKTGEAFAGPGDPYTAGNGCIMRLAPVPMFYFPDLDQIEKYSGLSSKTTHGAAECIDSCRLLGRMLGRALGGESKEEILFGDSDSFKGEVKIEALARGEWKEKTAEEIKTSAYVVETLEASLWCFFKTKSFSDALLLAVNLGGDTDTVGAVCGQIAGAHYGLTSIPRNWLEKLVLRDFILEVADRLFEKAFCK